MRVVLLCAALLCAASAQELTLGTPYVVGSAGYGYSFALQDGNGNVVLATNPAGDNPTVIIKMPLGASGAPEGEGTGQVPLLKNKGAVTCGCLVNSMNTQYFIGGLSIPGYAVQVDLSFPESGAIKYLNATDESLLWNNGPPHLLVSAVCKGNYVYFGTKADRVSTTVARLDVTNTNPNTRFQTLGAVAPGDLTFGADWGNDEILFAMEPDADTPLSFVTVTTGSSWSHKATTPVSPALPNFDILRGIYADVRTKRVVVASGLSDIARVALIDVSKLSTAKVLGENDFSTLGKAPIQTFLVDEDAHMAYFTVGSCATSDDLAVVAMRTAPSVAQNFSLSIDPVAFDCKSVGIPKVSLLVKPANDTLSPRQLLVFTEVEYVQGQSKRDGAVLPVTVFAATPCTDNCNNSEGHGVCVAGTCFCNRAWSGATCNVPVPCAGTDCSFHGQCVDNVCHCEDGFLGEFCAESQPCPLACSNRGTCFKGVCTCEAGFGGSGCELHTTGCESLNNCNGHGSCVAGSPSGTCDCQPGFSGDDCSVTDTSCPQNCSAHGICVNSACVCDTLWSGDDCSVAVSPCPKNCSQHGVCKNERCTCFQGFKGLDCATVDTASCVYGCSQHGTCSSAGICECQPGWKGKNCTQAVTELSVGIDTALQSGENAATSSFLITIAANEVVFCLGTSPAKCVGYQPDTMERVREASFVDQEPNALLLQEAASNSLSPVALVQLGAGVGDAPVAVALVEDTPMGYAILGTAASTGTMHGQLIKISTATLARISDIEFDDDNGRGVTAGCKNIDSTYFFASGSNPAMIYHVNAQLEILARVAVQSGEITALVYDTSKYLVAASGNTVFAFEVTTGSISPLTAAPSAKIASSLGSLTTGFMDVRVAGAPIAYIGTDGSPAAIVKVAVGSTGLDVQSVKLNAGEDHITTAVQHEDVAYFGIAVDGSANTCHIVKVSIPDLQHLDSVDVKDCTSNLLTATVSGDGYLGYFGNGASPAHVYTVKLNGCPNDCNQHGTCAQGVCTCSEGWTGETCLSEVARCPNDCSSAGTCDNGVCTCNSGHYGDDCSVTGVCADKCVHGQCTGTNGTWPCTCDNSAWGGSYCSEKQPSYCPKNCSGNGICENGACQCDLNHEGDDCATEKYPAVSLRGCKSSVDCHSHGTCEVDLEGTGSCKCNNGWTGRECDVTTEFYNAMKTDRISPALVGVLVVAAVLVGMIAGVSIWKSWVGSSGSKSSSPGVSAMGGEPSKVVASGGYARLPRRLVK